MDSCTPFLDDLSRRSNNGVQIVCRKMDCCIYIEFSYLHFKIHSALDQCVCASLSLYSFNTTPEPRMYLDREGNCIGNISPSWGQPNTRGISAQLSRHARQGPGSGTVRMALSYLPEHDDPGRGKTTRFVIIIIIHPSIPNKIHELNNTTTRNLVGLENIYDCQNFQQVFTGNSLHDKHMFPGVPNFHTSFPITDNLKSKIIDLSA